MRGVTLQRIAPPTAMLVALREDLASRCAELLVDAGLRVLKVGHAHAASERMAVVMPHLVVLPTTLSPEEADCADRCVAVGAELLQLAPDTNAAAMGALLMDAANAALVRALRRNG